jgi:hypothetical protein
MANEKKTSIYSDRGTIGSPEELDEYGVWVKNEPQDLSSTDFDYQKFPEESDLEMDLPDLGDDLAGEDLPEFDAGLDLESFPDLETTDDLADFETIPEENFSEELPDFDLPPEPQEDFLTSDQGPAVEDLPEFGDIGEDLDFSVESFPELPLEEDLVLSGTPQDDLSVSTDDMFEDPPEAEDRSPPRLEDTPADEFSPQDPEPPLEDVSMEDFLDTSSPGSVPPLLNDPVAEPPFSGNPPGEERAVSKGSDLSTQLLMRIADELSSIKVEISTLKEELTAFRRADTPREEPKKDKAPGFFDEEDDNEKITLTGDEINNILNMANFIEETGTDAAEDPPDDLVPEDFPPADLSPEEAAPESGAQDQSSRKTFPKFSLAEFPQTPEKTVPETVFAEAPVEDTGDTGEEPAETEDSDWTNPGLSPEELKIFELPELDDDDFSDIELLDIPGDSELPPEEPLPLPAEEPEEFQPLREEEAESPTETPEDLKYLEGESLVKDQDRFDDDVLDLTDAVIDEPNISGNLVENVLQEPSPDSIAINLDMEEPLIPEADDEPEDEPLEALVDEIGDLFIDDENAVELLHEDNVKPVDMALEPAELPEIFAGEADASPEALDKSPAAVEEPAEFPEIFAEEAGASPEALDKSPAAEEEPAELPEVFAEEADASPEALDKSPAAEEEPAEFPEIFAEEAGASPEAVPEEAAEAVPARGGTPGASGARPLPDNLKQELKVVLSYMDQILESLPDEKIEEFARSEHFNTYKKLFEELGLM